jgi:hypothetical protein
MDGEAAAATPRADFFFGLFWIVFGGAIAYGSWTMDRLEYLHINPYTAPGLVPGILGAFIALFGAIMMWRAWRAGALEAAAPGEPIVAPEGWRRIALTLSLCVGFSVGLVGHGPPFWLSAAIFVFLHVFLFEYPDRRAGGESAVRGLLVAAAVGVGAAFAITMIFQELFLVRLP